MSVPAMKRRRLKTWERAQLYRIAKGMCSNPECGKPLPPDWHADHTIPFVVSGRTNVYEMKALCPACNLKKGARYEPE
jgi:5-methylcytosine-specific restriction endonuclease McrA